MKKLSTFDVLCMGIFALVLIVIFIILIIHGKDLSDYPYVVIVMEDIRICGHYDKAVRDGDMWKITLRGGMRYMVPKEYVMFVSDPFLCESN